MKYTKIDSNWADLTTGIQGNTHGIGVTRDGTVIVFAQDYDPLLHFGSDGQFLSRHGGDGWPSAHGMTYQIDDGREVLWLTDHASGRVAKTTLTGEVIQELSLCQYVSPDDTDGGACAKRGYAPTWAVQDTDSGNIWVADGYGQFVVHHYDRQGKLLQTLTGVEGAGRFDCPHGLAIDEVGQLWIADRGNHRIAIYSADGRFIKAHDNLCHSPCGFDFTPDWIVVPELFGSIKVLDRDCKLVREIGRNPDIKIEIDSSGTVHEQLPDDWPNVDPASIPDQSFNSPHAACFGLAGEIYVAEWILGGRLTRVDPT